MTRNAAIDGCPEPIVLESPRPNGELNNSVLIKQRMVSLHSVLDIMDERGPTECLLEPHVAEILGPIIR
jgi:hypothetical protein